MSTGGSDLHLSAVARVNEACNRFELAWQAGQRPRIEDVLATVPESDRPALLHELIPLEVYYRRKAGEDPRREAYEQRFPNLAFSWEATPPDEAARAADIHAGGAAEMPVVPGYKILGELGRGGMGIVYRAFDPDLRRELAIKVFPRKQRGTPDPESRFLAEAQLMGQLQHPGLAPVHAVGRLADGRPFFAMKLVRGHSLAALLGERGSGDGVAGYLAIFAQVCQAMAYAHSRGVIHRDLKPANIMVGAFGEVQVVDWGLGKVLDRTRTPAVPAVAPKPVAITTVRTQTVELSSRLGSVLGTLAYMAPEQAQGEVDRLDERCDVFGLGAILCEILTGQPPYVSTALASEVRSAEMAEAYARLDGCGADAELVQLAKDCLAEEPAARPRDAGVVATTLGAYQAGVAERWRLAELERAAAAVRAGEERKRRRLRRALAAALLVLVLGAAGAVGWFLQERMQTRRGVDALLAQAREYQRQFRWAAAKAALTQAASRLGGGGPADLAERVRQAQADLDWVAELNEIRLKRSTLIGDRFAYAGAAAAYARTFRRAGLLYPEGQPRTQPQPIRLKIGTADTAATRLPAVAVDRLKASAVADAWVAALDDWALATGDDELRAHLLRAARQADPDAWRDRVRDPKVWKDRAALARLAEEGQGAHGSPQLLTLLGERLQLLGGDPVPLLRSAQLHYPTDFWLNFSLGSVLYTRPATNRNEAVGFLRAALAVRPDSAAVHSQLGVVLESLGRREEAIAHFEHALRLHALSVRTHYHLARALLALDRLDEAAKHFENALALNPSLAPAHHDLGTVRVRQGRPTEAIEHFGKVVALRPREVRARAYLAVALVLAGRWGGVIEQFRHVLRIYAPVVPFRPYLSTYAVDPSQWSKVIERNERILQSHPQNASAHHYLGNALLATGRREEAIAHYREAIRLKPDLLPAHCGLGQALQELGRLAEAQESFRQAHELSRELTGWRSRTASWVQEAERLVALDRRLPAILRGEDEVSDPADQLALAGLCRQPFQRRYAAAADFYTAAFAARPALAADLRSGHRFYAAGAAALAGSGQGEDAPPGDEPVRAHWRKQALSWLRADLALATGFLATGKPADRAIVRHVLQAWQRHPDLSGIRDAATLAARPPEEARACRDFWADAAALLRRAQDLHPSREKTS